MDRENKDLGADPVEWRDINGYEGLYRVSSAGHVQSVRSGRLMTPVLCPDGYETVQLSRSGAAPRFKIHRLVCAAFHGPAPRPEMHAAHADGNRRNNRADNLQWATAKENSAHKERHGTLQFGEKHPRAKLTEADVAIIMARGSKAAALAQRFRVSRHTIYDIWQGNRWAHAQAEQRP